MNIKKVLSVLTIFLAGGVCGMLISTQTDFEQKELTIPVSENSKISTAFFDFWLEETILEAEIETTYDEEANEVYIGDDITVYFDVETDEFNGVGMSYGVLDTTNLSSSQKKKLDYHRDQLVLSEIEKLFGSDSEKFQDVLSVVEDTQTS